MVSGVADYLPREGFAANALAAAALGYAALGWPVHPCRRDKTPLTGSWTRDATTDPATIAGWWRQWPRANVAVCTGAPGPDVLDVDCKHPGGMELCARARQAGLLDGAAAIIRTPSGGRHLWFHGTSQTGGAIGAHRALELKATGGYVLVPPSATDAGRYQLVERCPTPGFIDWPEVRRLLVPPAPRPRYYRTAATGARLAQWLSRQLEGNRNNALFWACCRAMEGGQVDLSDLVATAVRLGLSRREAYRTAESARRRARAGAPAGATATSGPGPVPSRARPGRPA